MKTWGRLEKSQQKFGLKKEREATGLLNMLSWDLQSEKKIRSVACSSPCKARAHPSSKRKLLAGGGGGGGGVWEGGGGGVGVRR